MYDKVPALLKQQKIWLNYNDSYKGTNIIKLKLNKAPRDINGHMLKDFFNRRNLYSECIKSIEAGYNTGLGIALTENTGIVAIDYDKVIKSIKPNGAIEFIDAETEQRILRDINLLKSYVEISPSNKGLHIYLIASININIKTPIEIYTNHFLRVTGKQCYYTDIREATEELKELMSLYKIDIDNTEDITGIKFTNSIYDNQIKLKFKYTNQLTDAEILKKMFTHNTKGDYYKKLYNNLMTEQEYIDFKTKKLKDLKRYKKIDIEDYERLKEKIDSTPSGKAFTLIMELLDFCYGDTKAVKRLFIKSKLCKSDYTKAKYKDARGKKTLDRIDRYFIPKAIYYYKNYRAI